VRKTGSSLVPTFLLVLAFANVVCLYRVDALDDECVRTSKMRIYSSAFVHKETGDLLGYDLALGPANQPTTDALLFIHEGSPGDGIPLQAKQSDGKVTIDGDWVEHLVEYPSKKETVKTHSIKITGTVGKHRLRGTIMIGGLTTTEKFSLKRVQKIWMCRAQ
jgi:hypothetical protein